MEILLLTLVRTVNPGGLLDNGGCTTSSGSYTYHDDTALGVGLQSCLDSNSCSNGGSGHLAGQLRAVDGVQDVVFGPWFVFGR